MNENCPCTFFHGLRKRTEPACSAAVSISCDPMATSALRIPKEVPLRSGHISTRESFCARPPERLTLRKYVLRRFSFLHWVKGSAPCALRAGDLIACAITPVHQRDPIT